MLPHGEPAVIVQQDQSLHNSWQVVDVQDVRVGQPKVQDVRLGGS